MLIRLRYLQDEELWLHKLKVRMDLLEDFFSFHFLTLSYEPDAGSFSSEYEPEPPVRRLNMA